ncbi:hypothetical protein AM593_04658, partial [Mytilus galloprovincialis]
MVDGQNGQSGVIVQKLAEMKTLLELDHVQILCQKITEQFAKDTTQKQFRVTLQIVQLMVDGLNGQSGVIVQKLAEMKTLLELEHAQILCRKITEQLVKEATRKQFLVLQHNVQ